MSILVNFLKMPNNCDDCIVSCDCPVDASYDGYKMEGGRPRYCPLTELPPHGRLIDATFEENHYASMLLNPTPDVTEQDKKNARIIIDALRMAGTVIDAEGSE